MVQDPRGKLDSPAKRLALLQKSAGDAADAFSLGFCQVWGASGPVWDHPAFADAVADTGTLAPPPWRPERIRIYF